MQDHIPPQMKNSFRIVLELNSAQKRLDTTLLQALRDQNEDINLKNISRTDFKCDGQNEKARNDLAFY